MNLIRALWATEPVRVITIVAAIVVFVFAKAGVVIDQQDVLDALVIVLPILLGGEAARTQVSPATPDIGDDSDALLASKLAEASA